MTAPDPGQTHVKWADIFKHGNGTRRLGITATICLAVCVGAICVGVLYWLLKPGAPYAPITIVSPGQVVNPKTPGVLIPDPVVHVGDPVTTRRSVCNSEDEPIRALSEKWWQEESGAVQFRSEAFKSVNDIPSGCATVIFTHPMPPDVIAETRNQLNSAPFVYWSINGSSVPVDGKGEQGAPVLWTTVRVKVVK